MWGWGKTWSPGPPCYSSFSTKVTWFSPTAMWSKSPAVLPAGSIEDGVKMCLRYIDRSSRYSRWHDMIRSMFPPARSTCRSSSVSVPLTSQSSGRPAHRSEGAEEGTTSVRPKVPSSEPSSVRRSKRNKTGS